jgi:hypothetical protein
MAVVQEILREIMSHFSDDFIIFLSDLIQKLLSIELSQMPVELISLAERDEDSQDRNYDFPLSLISW